MNSPFDSPSPETATLSGFTSFSNHFCPSISVWANKAFREYYGMGNDGLRELIEAPLSNPDCTQSYVRDDTDDTHVFTTGQSIEVEEPVTRSEEHTSELQSLTNLVCRLLLEKKKKKNITT